MKKILLIAMAAFAVSLYSCKTNDGDPKAVLGDFFEALSNKNMEKARSLATTDSKSMIDLIEMGMKSDSGRADNMQYDKKNMEFGEVKIDGDKATIPVKELKSGETVNYSLKKESGSWKVAFDKSTLMNIGMEKMNEKGGMENMMSPADSLNQKLDELKDVNMDSLKKAMEESMNQSGQ